MGTTLLISCSCQAYSCNMDVLYLNSMTSLYTKNNSERETLRHIFYEHLKFEFWKDLLNLKIGKYLVIK